MIRSGCRLDSRNQSLYDFLDNRVGFSLNFHFGLILNWVCDVDRIEIRPAQSCGLSTRGGHKLMRRHRNRRDSQILQL